ncbi:MAG: CYTH domain-containing protein [Candidatus Eisenbacteria bacterium]
MRVEVRKRRSIYFIGNVKFHLDHVDGLGEFVEIEAIGAESEVPRLREQCEQHRNNLGISSEDLVGASCSDLLMRSAS